MILETLAKTAWNELLAKPHRKLDNLFEGGEEFGAILYTELLEFMRRAAPQVTPARTSGPRAVVLDAQGRPVLPPPMAAQFEGERRNQYALDRHMAVMSLDPDQWRIFALRWGLVPPPGGWENREAILNVMHAVRLGVRSVPYIDKHFSAVYLKGRGIALPQPLRLEGGVLVGHDTDESNPG